MQHMISCNFNKRVQYLKSLFACRVLQDRRPIKRTSERPVREEDWPPKRHIIDRYDGPDK